MDTISDIIDQFTSTAAPEPEETIFKTNMTLQKLFNLSIPIDKKFPHFFSNNISSEINKLDIIPPIPPSTNFASFMCSLVFAMFWVTYITFFNSRLVGSLITYLANKFLFKLVKRSYIKVGSLSFSVLAGKIMFRDFVFITPDKSVRVQDGYIIFRWWRSYIPKVTFISSM